MIILITIQFVFILYTQFLFIIRKQIENFPINGISKYHHPQYSGLPNPGNRSKTSRLDPVLLVHPLAAARLHRVATSFKLTQCPIILFFPHHPFHNCKANKTYSFRIFEFIISTRCNFYYFELLYFPDLTRDAIARQRGFIRDQPTKTFNLQLRKPDITRGRPLLCLY